MRWRWRARPGCDASRIGERIAGFALAAVLLAGCGYTQLRAPGDGALASGATGDSTAIASDSTTLDLSRLPPNHPRILSAEEWEGRSLLDDIVGEDDPLRFESLRRHPAARDPNAHAEITFRITLGGPAIARIWQIHMDQFGWVKAAYWTQGEAGPRLDESLAAQRAEFRLARESESALREMAIQLLPVNEAPQIAKPDRPLSLPTSLWPYDDPGRIDIEYRIETLTAVSPEDWPGGSVSAPLDLIELLIQTWDAPPPRDLRRLARAMAERSPMMIDVAMLAEALVLAWEVEGYDQADRLELPLHVLD
jgi:hypothetical protein